MRGCEAVFVFLCYFARSSMLIYYKPCLWKKKRDKFKLDKLAGQKMYWWIHFVFFVLLIIYGLAVLVFQGGKGLGGVGGGVPGVEVQHGVRQVCIHSGSSPAPPLRHTETHQHQNHQRHLGQHDSNDGLL